MVDAPPATPLIAITSHSPGSQEPASSNRRRATRIKSLLVRRFFVSRSFIHESNPDKEDKTLAAVTERPLRTFKPIADMNDLTGTILDPERSDKDLVIRLPRGIFEDVTSLRLPARLRKLKLSETGIPVLTDIQRATDRLVQAVSDHHESKHPADDVSACHRAGQLVFSGVAKSLAWIQPVPHWAYQCIFITLSGGHVSVIGSAAGASIPRAQT